MFNFLLEKKVATDPVSFQGLCMKNNPVVEDYIQANIFLNDVNFVDGALTGEVARRSCWQTLQHRMILVLHLLRL